MSEGSRKEKKKKKKKKEKKITKNNKKRQNLGENWGKVAESFMWIA